MFSNISNTGHAAAYKPLSLDDFRAKAGEGESLQVRIDGASYRLIASGKTPSGRSVDWVDGGDTTKMFVEAMASAYGASLARAIADELGLSPAPGKGISSRTVQQALSMIETASAALEGVRFAEGLKV